MTNYVKTLKECADSVLVVTTHLCTVTFSNVQCRWIDESVVLTLNGVGLEHVLLLKTLLLNKLMLWSGLDDL